MKRQRKWFGERLKKLKADYDNWSIPMREVAEKHGTSLGRLSQLARREQWSPRRGRSTDDRLVALRARLASLRFRIKRDHEEMKRIERVIADE